MKLNYFAYVIHDKNNNSYHLHDLAPFLRAFAAVNNSNFKNKFKAANGENVYLFPSAPNVYLYAMTKSNELIKKIDTNNIGIDEIYTSLERGEEVGFASFVYLGKYFYGLASTVLGPRNKSFSEFVNNVLIEAGLSRYQFVAMPLMYQSDIEEVLEIPIVGRTRIEVTNGNKLFGWFTDLLGGDSGDINSFEVIIKPKPYKDISKQFVKFNKMIGDKGITKYVVKAKYELDEALTDFYLETNGAISDKISKDKDSKIATEISSKATSNKILKSKIKEFIDGGIYEQKTLSKIASFNDVGTWSSYLSSL